MGKDFLGISVFHHFAQIEEGCFVADAGCLLHAVRDDNDGRLLAEFADQFLDLGRRNRIQADAGSSISRTDGSTAMARAIHSLCCCPPESA